jgi:hypothetical protein
MADPELRLCFNPDELDAALAAGGAVYVIGPRGYTRGDRTFVAGDVILVPRGVGASIERANPPHGSAVTSDQTRALVVELSAAPEEAPVADALTADLARPAEDEAALIITDGTVLAPISAPDSAAEATADVGEATGVVAAVVATPPVEPPARRRASDRATNT